MKPIQVWSVSTSGNENLLRTDTTLAIEFMVPDSPELDGSDFVGVELPC